MAAAVFSVFRVSSSSFLRRRTTSSAEKPRPEITSPSAKPKSVNTRRIAVSTTQQAPISGTWSVPEKEKAEEERTARGKEEVSRRRGETKKSPPWALVEPEVPETEGLGLKDYVEQSKQMIGRDGGGGGPRWFSPLECAARLGDSPLLLFLPGIDGVGLGLIRHHQRLGKIFDIWCLHIPVMDRTSFTDLLKLVERTLRSEKQRSPNRPIYLVGESLGACLALAVAACNPNADLVLILANPATSYGTSRLQILLPLLEVMPEQLSLGLPYLLGSITGDPLRKATTTLGRGLSLQDIVGMLSKDLSTMSAFLSVLADILPKETLLWRLKMLKSASAYVNSHLHAVKAETLILYSGNDQLFPIEEEVEKLCLAIPKCDVRKFDARGHFLFLEDGVDLVTTIKGARFYRRTRCIDYVSDYIPPTSAEFTNIYEPCRWLCEATNPVMLSTLEDGKIERSIAGIPSEGPVLLVGYHMLLGLELIPLVSQFWIERKILLRGMAHPMLFTLKKDGSLPSSQTYDTVRMMGAVPVSAVNFYKLLSSKSHVLLYPGGMREALHRKGEEYKLFWPEQSEFVRMAARFGAKIVPFGAVGEDDLGEVVFDYDDLVKIPYFRDQIEELTNEAAKLRTDATGEVSNQQVHLPWILPKLPGRFYYYFGKPIDTAGRKRELRDKEKSQELYLQIRSEVERCIAYLKEKRESDPYRSLFSRLPYRATHGPTSKIPTFRF